MVNQISKCQRRQRWDTEKGQIDCTFNVLTLTALLPSGWGQEAFSVNLTQKALYKLYPGGRSIRSQPSIISGKCQFNCKEDIHSRFFTLRRPFRREIKSASKLFLLVYFEAIFNFVSKRRLKNVSVMVSWLALLFFSRKWCSQNSQGS